MTVASTPIQGILFDKDGTLVDYDKTWAPLNRQVAALAAQGDPDLAARLLEIGGYDVEADRVVGGSLLAASHTQEIAAAWIEAGAKHELAALTRAMDEIFAAGAQHAVPVTDVADLFRRLRSRGLALGVATSDGEAAARATLARLGVETDDLFVAGYDSGFGGKPKPGMVEGFCRAMGLPAGAVAVVGDNLHDLEMAHAAGCAAAIGVLSGTATADELAHRASAVIASIAELEALLDRWPVPA
ncbi:HAD family hydrolase [Ferruginivarius sediminum]|uniref:HAD family hydrolase n=1 Tax=Ferruginivarius sediminum TaxID=2661937 RepID=UPI0019D4E646|nr:HAD family hydrolase [Ferruginivarius sediminum]